MYGCDHHSTVLRTIYSGGTRAPALCVRGRRRRAAAAAAAAAASGMGRVRTASLYLLYIVTARRKVAGGGPTGRDAVERRGKI